MSTNDIVPGAVSMGNEMLGAALDLLRLKLSPMPLCWPNGRRCGCGKEQRGMKIGAEPLESATAEVTESDVLRWWEAHPQANVGIDIRKSRLAVLRVPIVSVGTQLVADLLTRMKAVRIPGPAPAIEFWLDNYPEVFKKPRAVPGVGYLRVSGFALAPPSRTLIDECSWIGAGDASAKPPQWLVDYLAEDRETESIVLDRIPDELRRPLSISGSRGFAATWPWVQKYVFQKLVGDTYIDLPRPEIITYRPLQFIRDDGFRFGNWDDPEVDATLDDLGVLAHLKERPLDERLWSPAGVRKYNEGLRADPLSVFDRVGAVINHFVDFGSSLSDQTTMSAMMACYVLSTYFIEAIPVVGYLWVTGASGSGKTQLVAALAELCYLGGMTTAGGSFASLRDLADAGGFIGFDEADKLMDARSDSEKQALVLTGNRRGARITVKEPLGDKGWRTRSVDVFCSKAFASIELPPPTLFRRSIVVPMVRSSDPARANADPTDHETWPTERRALLDNLWALCLEHIAIIRKWDRQAVQHAGLSGANLDPWRGILAVATMLDAHGGDGIYARMRSMAVKYQDTKKPYEADDLTRLVVIALCQCAISAIGADYANSDRMVTVTIKDVHEVVEYLSREAGPADPSAFTANKVGHALSQLGLGEVPRAGGQGSRRRQCTGKHIGHLVEGYRIDGSSGRSD